MLKSKDRTTIDVLIVTFFCIFTVGIFGPLDSYCSNASEFWFPIAAIIPTLCISSIILWGICFWFLTFLPARFLNVALAIAFGLGLALYLQGNYLTINYGILNGTEIDWNSYTSYGVFNSLIWAACLLLPLVLLKLYPELLKKTIRYVSLFVISIQIVTLTVLLISSPLKGNSEINLTERGLLEVSDQENIIMFILDTFDASYFDEILAKNIEYKQKFKDFTYFQNAVSGGAPTIYGIPLLLTGQHYYNNMSYEQYLFQAYSQTEIYKELKKQDYNIGIYTEPSYLDARMSEIVDNIDQGQSSITSRTSLSLQMYKLTAYKYTPHFLKKYFWFYSGEFDNYRKKEDSYILDDVAYNEKLQSQGLTINHEKNSFKVIHLFGAHGPYSMDENVKRVKEGKSDYFRQSIGTLKIVENYIDELKRLDLYDNANIIITGDHGGIELYQNPLILVKQKNNDWENMKISQAPIAFMDILPTIASFFGEPDAYEGRSIFEYMEDEVRERTHMAVPILAEPYTGNTYNTGLVEFLINGNVREKSSIIEMGEASALHKEILDYRIGKQISFLPDEKGMQYTYNGFSHQEVQGIWTCSTDAELKMNVAKVPDMELLLEMEFNSVHAGAQRMEVWINEICIGEKEITRLKESFIIPKGCLVNGPLTIRFKLKDAIAPYEISPDLVDDRKLAFYFKSFKIKKNE